MRSIKYRSCLYTSLVLLLLLSGCDSIVLPTNQPPAGAATDEVPVAARLTSLPETLVNFIMEAPADTPVEDSVYFTVLDEVTGLALNAQAHPMQAMSPAPDAAAPTNEPRIYVVTVPAAIGAMIQYRYERQSSTARVAEHLPDGSPVRYRMFRVDGPNTIRDRISRWTDTGYNSSIGSISGQATDAVTGLPINNLLVSAAGKQALTTADGSFRLEGLPPGTHNLVIFALDGAYQTFQQGATVAANSDTPAMVKLAPASYVKVIFVVSVPQETPPVVPVRLAGNLSQLGNTFASLNGGISSIASRMPVLNQLPDGRYMLSMDLPVGADIRYKYTLGDGFWNAEHKADGSFRLHQAVIPAYNVLIDDTVDTWHQGGSNSLTFDVTVPADTPPGDSVSIQFNPLFGWTEPIPMWQLGENRWGYILYSPLNLPGNFSYRYCRNGQCGVADDSATPGLYGKGRLLEISDQPQTVWDQVSVWQNSPRSINPAEIPQADVSPRGASFWTGIEFQPAWHPSWKTQLPTALGEVQALGANWLVLAPTWSFSLADPEIFPPFLEPNPAQDILWPDLAIVIQQAKEKGLSIALAPAPRFPGEAEGWWFKARRDAFWWEIWFREYRRFILHHADLAAQSGAAALILGGEWVKPALPGGSLADGSPSYAPADADQRWQRLLREVRAHYSGSILWSLSIEDAAAPPAFLAEVDQLYLTYTISLADQQAAASGQRDLGANLAGLLDGIVQPLQAGLDKPVILAVAAPGDPFDPLAQMNSYAACLRAASQRQWISGFVSQGYYPPAAAFGGTISIHGSPTSQLLQAWFPTLLGK